MAEFSAAMRWRACADGDLSNLFARRGDRLDLQLNVILSSLAQHRPCARIDDAGGTIELPNLTRYDRVQPRTEH